MRQQFLRSQKLEGIERDCEKQVANYKDQLKRSEAYALSWEQKMEAAIGHDNVDNVVELIAKLKAELATERQAREALQEQLDSAQADPGVDVKDAAKGYLVRAPKRKLRVCNRGELAVQAAKAAAKNGSGYADVYALVQMGRAVRGAEWVESK